MKFVPKQTRQSARKAEGASFDTIPDRWFFCGSTPYAGMIRIRYKGLILSPAESRTPLSWQAHFNTRKRISQGAFQK